MKSPENAWRLVAVELPLSYPSMVNADEKLGVAALRIQWISVGKLPPLEDVYLDCDERVNLFIGPNASGKSTILRAIEDLSSSWGDGDEFDSGNSYPIYGKGYKNASVHVGVNYGCPTDTGYFPVGADSRDSGMSIWEAVPFLYIPATRVSLRSQNIFDHTIHRPEPYGFNLSWNDIIHRHFCNSWGNFQGEYVEEFFDHLRQESRAEPVRQDQLRRAIAVSYSCAKSICLEVIYEDTPQAYVEVISEDELDEDDPEFYPKGRVVHFAMGIGTTDDPLGEPLYAGALSSGTQSTLLWIRALSLKIAYHYDWAEGWEDKPAILLIDEIENHLHPTWQRRVIPALLKHFPGLQIFATTHSPFVVAGLKAGQVHLLKREGKGVDGVETKAEDIIGWTADEILRTIMGVDDPTDDETAAAARKLRQLRQEGPHPTREGEEQRQQEIQELRAKVNRDLLAGGPEAAQRELFERQFSEALNRHLESRNLNQENG